MTGLFEGKRIVVTGGAGSLGRALTRRLMSGAEATPESVTVFFRDKAKQHVDEPVIDRSLNSMRFGTHASWTPPTWGDMLSQLASGYVRHYREE